MQIFKFGQEVAHHITHYNSNFDMSRIVITEKPAHVGCMYLAANGIVGLHQATSPQLLIVVSGQGWVRSDSQEGIKISTGDAVFWVTGEWHETKSDAGLMAIVIESDELDPSRFMMTRG